MKIAQVAPVWERVPPRKYGGIELVVHLLTEELVRRGHDVTLFATSDSVTKAKLESWYHTPPPRSILGNPVPDLLHTGLAFHKVDRFDVIHNHTGYTGIVFGSFVNKPVLNTLHGVFTDINYPFYDVYKKAVYYNSISFEQRKLGPKEMNYVGNVYNAIDVDSYPFRKQKKNYFIYLSRISQTKGSDVAVDVALKAGVKLVMAGKIDPGTDTAFYNERIAPKVDGKQIIFKGEVSEREKRILFRDAKGFIFPLQWSEPFGLVMVEAMAAGTPVIAFPLGSVPELVENGKTGYIVKDVNAMAQALKDIDKLDPSQCRKRVEEKFGIARMVDDYEKLYKKIIRLKSG